MKSSFYYDGHHLEAAGKIRDHINASPDFLSSQTARSTRAVGDAIEFLISEKFDAFLRDWCVKYSNDFARRAMADLAFTDREGFYSVVDVKTHREDTKFNMPNLTSVERLARFYESDKNVFSLIMVKYAIDDTRLRATEVIFLSHRIPRLGMPDRGCAGVGTDSDSEFQPYQDKSWAFTQRMDASALRRNARFLPPGNRENQRPHGQVRRRKRALGIKGGRLEVRRCHIRGNERRKP